MQTIINIFFFIILKLKFISKINLFFFIYIKIRFSILIFKFKVLKEKSKKGMKASIVLIMILLFEYAYSNRLNNSDFSKIELPQNVYVMPSSSDGWTC